jgi:hypothetical protein
VIVSLSVLALAAALAADPPPPPEAPPAWSASEVDPAADPAAEPGAPTDDPERSAAEVSGLIQRCVEAYGGERGLVRLARVRGEGTTSSALHAGDRGRFVRVYQRTGRLRVEVQFPHSSPELRLLDGGRAWRYGEEARRPFVLAMQLHAARLDLPALLSIWEARVEDRGALPFEGVALRVLALEIAPGVVVEAGIDPATGRILRTRGTAQSGPRRLEFVTVYREFRAVDGVLVPLREASWANGQPTGEVVLERVELLDEVPEETFRP